MGKARERGIRTAAAALRSHSFPCSYGSYLLFILTSAIFPYSHILNKTHCGHSRSSLNNYNVNSCVSLLLESSCHYRPWIVCNISIGSEIHIIWCRTELATLERSPPKKGQHHRSDASQWTVLMQLVRTLHRIQRQGMRQWTQTRHTWRRYLVGLVRNSYPACA